VGHVMAHAGEPAPHLATALPSLGSDDPNTFRAPPGLTAVDSLFDDLEQVRVHQGLELQAGKAKC
jgi:hypothetical protein